MECTGLFTKREAAEKLLTSGARKVLISAPGVDCDLTVVYGVNHDRLKKSHKVVSNASCTTNCLAPVAYALNNPIGVEKGFMTTVHAYTGDQPTLDTHHGRPPRPRRRPEHDSNLHGRRPAVGLVLPDWSVLVPATRVPTPNGP